MDNIAESDISKVDGVKRDPDSVKVILKAIARNIVQSQKNVAYMFTGSMSIKDSLIEDVAGKNGAFGGRMLSIDISPFSFETTKNYLKERADFLEFSEYGYDRFYKCTKGVSVLH